MGTDNPKIGKPETTAKTHFPLFFIGLAVLLAGIVLFPKIDVEEGHKTPKLHPKEEEKLLKRLREIDDSEQYALVATKDGWYPCMHSGRTTYYLKAGEVWKYGVTSKGRIGRYTLKFLIRNQVTYHLQFKVPSQTVLSRNK